VANLGNQWAGQLTTRDHCSQQQEQCSNSNAPHIACGAARVLKRAVMVMLVPFGFRKSEDKFKGLQSAAESC